jgi:predicted DNA-binding transcriptional regulator AlpA
VDTARASATENLKKALEKKNEAVAVGAPATFPAPDRVLTFAECRARLGVSRATFHRKLRHKLPVVRLSDRRFGVRESALLRWLDANESGAA